MTTDRHNWGPQQWADYIVAAHGRTVASIVETGKRWGEYREAIHADKQIGWGDKVFDLTGYGKRSANRHILIHEKLSPIGTRFSELPSSWRALSELALLDPDRIEALLNAGLVSRSSTRNDIVIAVKVAKDVLPHDFRLEFGTDYFKELQDAVMDFQAVTEAVTGEAAEPGDMGGPGSTANPEGRWKPAGNPRLRAIRKMTRAFDKWADGTDKPFEDPDARDAMVGFIKHWAKQLGLTVTEKSG